MARLLLAMLFACGAVQASESDADLLYRVKAAIAAEPRLQGASLTISLKDGVAVMGGAVPTDEANEILLKVVKGVSGVKAARADCWVSTATDPLQAAMRDKLKLASERGTPKPLPATPRLPVLTPVADLDAAYSPVPPPAPPAPPGPKEYPTIAPPKVPVSPSQNVEQAVEAVRRGDGRYGSLTVNVNAGAVAVSAPAQAMAEAWAFAAEVRKVPGVERVVIGTIGKGASNR